MIQVFSGRKLVGALLTISALTMAGSSAKAQAASATAGGYGNQYMAVYSVVPTVTVVLPANSSDMVVTIEVVDSTGAAVGGQETFYSNAGGTFTGHARNIARPPIGGAVYTVNVVTCHYLANKQPVIIIIPGTSCNITVQP